MTRDIERRVRADPPGIITPELLKALRTALAMTTVDLASWLKLKGAHGSRQVRAWEAGEQSISGPVSRAVELLATSRGVDVEKIRRGLAEEAEDYESERRAHVFAPEE